MTIFQDIEKKREREAEAEVKRRVDNVNAVAKSILDLLKGKGMSVQDAVSAINVIQKGIEATLVRLPFDDLEFPEPPKPA